MTDLLMLRVPAARQRALREVLAPQGSLNLMVYAPYDRAGIYLLQDYCRCLCIGTSPKEIEDLAEILRALPQCPSSYEMEHRSGLSLGGSGSFVCLILAPVFDVANGVVGLSVSWSSLFP
jgi:hypothetical protein